VKKLGIAVVVLLVVIVIALLVVPAFIDVNSYRGRIQTELERELNRPVTLGQLHLSLLPLAFRADNAVIGEDPGFRSPHAFAEVQQLSVSAALIPLLHGEVQVSSLELDSPKIELVRNEQGVWNFASLGAGPGQAARTAAPPQSRQARNKPSPERGTLPAASSGSNFSLEDLKIKDGELAVTDYQQRQPRTVYDHIDLRLIGYEPGRAFTMQAAANLPAAAGTGTIKLEGEAGPVDNAVPANTPFKGKAQFEKVSLGALERFLKSQALTDSNAVVTGSANVENGPNRFASDGALKLDQVVLHGSRLGYPITADYAVSNQEKVLHIEKGDLKLGDTPVKISGTVNTEPTPAEIDLQVDVSEVSVQEVARLAAAQGIAFNPGMNVTGRFTANLHAQGALSQPALNGAVSANNLVISGKELAQPVNVSDIQLALSPSEAHTNNFTATTGGTALHVRFALSQYTTSSPQIDADVQTANANLGEFLSIAKAYGVSAADGVTGSGGISLNVHASGPLKNSAAMVFSGNGSLLNASLKSPAISQPLQVRNADLRFSQNAAVLQNLSASLGSTHASGTLTVKDFKHPQLQFALSADKISASEMEQIFSAQPQSRAPSAQPSLLEEATGSGTLNVGSLSYQDLLLTNVRSNATLDHGIIKLDPLTAQVCGGQENGSIVIDTRTTPSTYTITSKLNKVDANQLLSSVSSVKQTLYGLLAADTNSRFTSQGDMARNLNGTAGLDLANGRLAHVDVLYEMARIGKFLGGGRAATNRGFTNINHLAGNFNIQNGIAATNDLKADIDGGSLAGVGAINLADQAINMHVTAVLNKAQSQQVGGTNVGGYLTTALANKNGELVMPLLVTGSLASPHILPDVEQIARMRLQNILPTSTNPGALTNALGAILNKNSGASGGQTQPQGGLQGILGSLGQNQPPRSANTNPQQPAPAQPAQQPQKKQTWQDIVNGMLSKKQPPPPPPPKPQPQPQKQTQKPQPKQGAQKAPPPQPQ
jgi:uncharacterized protein involved in outer membrane biogenesis